MCWHGLGPRNGLAFNELGPLLADRGWRVVAVDAPGWGASAPLPYESYSPSLLAAIVPQLLDELGLRSCTYLGFSWGASIGCYVGANHSERIDALVFLDAGFDDPVATASTGLAESVEQARRAFADGAPDWPAALAPYQERSARWTPAVEAQWRAAFRMGDDGVALAVDPGLLGAAQWGLAQEPASGAWDRLARARTPLLLLTAESADTASVERWSQIVSQAEIRGVPSPTHDVVVNAPHEVRDAIADWAPPPG